MDKKIEHKGNILTFNEEAHSYLLNDKVKMTSATRFIKDFFAPFDKEKIAFFYGRKHNMTKNEVIAMWEEKGRIAAQFGTNCHYYAECLINGVEPPKPLDKIEKYVFGVIEKAIIEFEKHLDWIEAEKFVFSPKNKIAGIIDLLARHKKTGEIFILDWKTNKEILFKSKYYKYGFKPIEHLYDCNGIHYTLQLNLYQHILTQQQYFEGVEYKRMLIHVNQKDFNLVNIKDSQKDIKGMIKYKGLN